MSGEKAGSKQRQERLAAALRDNLRRRKTAHRPDQGTPAAAEPTEAPGPDGAAPRSVEER